MSPRVFLRAAVWLTLGVCVFASLLGYYDGVGLAYHFDEGHISTYLSCAELLLTAFFAFRTLAARRRQTAWSGVRTPWLVWFFVGAGFVYLALDDALRFHERIDHFIHKIFHLQETGLSDRIDDFVVIAYAVGGLGVLYFYRKELLSVRGMFPYLGLGVVFTAIQSSLDVLGDRPDILGLVVSEPNHLHRLGIITNLAEGVTEALAEAFLLVAFYTAFYLSRYGRNRRDSATDQAANS